MEVAWLFLADVALWYELPLFLSLQFDPQRECNYTNAPEFAKQMRLTSTDAVIGKGLFNLNSKF